MNVARAILAFLIAVSLIALPAAGQAHVAVKPMDAPATHPMAATYMAAMDCCPHKSDASHMWPMIDPRHLRSGADFSAA